MTLDQWNELKVDQNLICTRKDARLTGRVFRIKEVFGWPNAGYKHIQGMNQGIIIEAGNYHTMIRDYEYWEIHEQS